MAAKTIEIRAKYRDGVTTVNALITHPMTAGGAGRGRSPHFIQEVTCHYGETLLLTAQWGPGMPMNPYLSFQFEGGEKGRTVTLKWVDNRGGGDRAEAVIR